MAVKDWKKFRKDVWRKNDGSTISIHKRIQKDGWAILINFEGDTQKNFKTKSPALKFAMKYIRTK